MWPERVPGDQDGLIHGYLPCGHATLFPLNLVGVDRDLRHWTVATAADGLRRRKKLLVVFCSRGPLGNALEDCIDRGHVDKGQGAGECACAAVVARLDAPLAAVNLGAVLVEVADVARDAVLLAVSLAG